MVINNRGDIKNDKVIRPSPQNIGEYDKSETAMF